MKVTIEKLDHQGRGIAHIDGKITFVDNALPNEIVDIELVKKDKKINEATVKQYIKRSSKRIKSICPYFKVCGGCDLLHLSYEDQLIFKENKVKEIMSRYGNISEDKIKHIIRSTNNFNYRNKVTLKSNGHLGYYKRRTNSIININYCYLLDNSLNDMIEKLNILGISKDIDEVALRKLDRDEKSMTFYLQKGKKKMNDICKYENIATQYAIISDNKLENITTKSNIIAKIGDKKYKISPMSFFQVNTIQIVNLYNIVLEYVKKFNNPTVLDLYCGTGTIGIYICDYAKNVLGVEINSNAIINAQENAILNNVKNIKFISGDTKFVLAQNNFKADIVILDPPRAGLDKNVVEDLLKIYAKGIIYVSCDPMTVARDIKLLSDKYYVEEVTPVDMFPNTYHVETVVLLSQKKETVTSI